MSSWLPKFSFWSWRALVRKLERQTQPQHPNPLRPPFSVNQASPVLMAQVELFLRLKHDIRASTVSFVDDPLGLFIGSEERATLHEISSSIHVINGQVSKAILIMDPGLNERIGAILIPDKYAPVCIGVDFYKTLWFAPRKYNEKELIRPLETITDAHTYVSSFKELSTMALPSAHDRLRKALLELVNRHWPEGLKVGEAFQFPTEGYILEFRRVENPADTTALYKLVVLEDRKGVGAVVMFSHANKAIEFTEAPNMTPELVTILVDQIGVPPRIVIGGQTEMLEAALDKFLDKAPCVSTTNFNPIPTRFELGDTYSLSIGRFEDFRPGTLRFHVYNSSMQLLAKIIYCKQDDVIQVETPRNLVDEGELIKIFDYSRYPVKYGHGAEPVTKEGPRWSADNEADDKWCRKEEWAKHIKRIFEAAPDGFLGGLKLWDNETCWAYIRQVASQNTLELTLGYNGEQKGPQNLITYSITGEGVLDAQVTDPVLSKIGFNTLAHYTLSVDAGCSNKPSLQTAFQLLRQTDMFKKFLNKDVAMACFSGRDLSLRCTVRKPDPALGDEYAVATYKLQRGSFVVASGVIRVNGNDTVQLTSKDFIFENLRDFVLEAIAVAKEAAEKDRQRLGPWEGIINTKEVRDLRRGDLTSATLADNDYCLSMTPVREMMAPRNIEFTLASLQIPGVTLATGVITFEDVIQCERHQGVSEEYVDSIITAIANWYGWRDLEQPAEGFGRSEPYEMYRVAKLDPADEPPFVNLTNGELNDEWVTWYAKTNNVSLSKAVVAGLHLLEGLMLCIQKQLLLVGQPGDKK